jgi:Recombination endonuclease VII
MADVREPTLFDVASATSDAAPRCRMCARPARWMPSRREFGMYCAGASCTNRLRLCQNCGSEFHIGVDGAGTKYCSPDCKSQMYGRSVPGSSVLQQECAWCGKRAPKGSRHGLGRPERIWPYICSDCTSPIHHLIHGLRKHHVPHEMAHRLLDDPGCEICGRDIVVKVRDPNTGRVSSLLTVDHDHNCCPGQRSCGLCVRGLLCTQCNCAAGLLGDDSERAMALARYVERWSDDSSKIT